MEKEVRLIFNILVNIHIKDIKILKKKYKKKINKYNNMITYSKNKPMLFYIHDYI